MDISAIRTALKEAIEQIDGLEVTDLRDNPNVPCAIVYPDTPFQFDFTFAPDVFQEPKFLVLVLVPYVDTDDAQTQMDVYLSPEGDSSIKSAIDNSNALGGLVGDAHVTGLASYGVMSLHDGGTRYLSAELTVQIYT